MCWWSVLSFVLDIYCSPQHVKPFCKSTMYKIRHKELNKRRYYNSHIFSFDQAALRTLISVCPSVCPSVRLSHLFDNVPLIVSFWNFLGIITIDRHDVHAKGQGQRSKFKVTEVMTSFSRFQTVTPVWIWRWNDAQSLVLLRRGTLLFFKIIRQISRSHG